MHFTGEREPNTKQTKHEWICEERHHQQQHKRKTNPWISLLLPFISCMMVWFGREGKISIHCISEDDANNLSNEENLHWKLMRAHKQLKKHSIKIQSIFITVRECRMPFNVSKKVLQQFVHMCCACTDCYRAASTLFCSAYIWSHARLKYANLPGQTEREKFHAHIFWSFSCIFEIHSLDTLNNYLHCSA